MRMTLRLIRLCVGLFIFGVGVALMVQAGIGLDPWTVLAEGIARRSGLGIGWVILLIGAAVLLMWIPLRQKPGIGTIANILLVGLSVELAVAVIPPITGWFWQLLVFLIGLVVLAIASGIYIGAHLGPGPRDGLMTGLNARLGWPIWLSRFIVEGTVLFAGWLLGGTVGIGTVLFALLIGPAVHVSLAFFDPRRPRRTKLRRRSHRVR